MGEVNKVRKAKDSEKIKNLVDQWVDTYQTNFNTWIHKMRIAEAQRLIMENPQTALGQIASMTGYTDQAHFCKQFRVVTGTSPTKWRKENADN